MNDLNRQIAVAHIAHKLVNAGHKVVAIFQEYETPDLRKGEIDIVSIENGQQVLNEARPGREMHMAPNEGNGQEIVEQSAHLAEYAAADSINKIRYYYDPPLNDVDRKALERLKEAIIFSIKKKHPRCSVEFELL